MGIRICWCVIAQVTEFGWRYQAERVTCQPEKPYRIRTHATESALCFMGVEQVSGKVGVEADLIGICGGGCLLVWRCDSESGGGHHNPSTVTNIA